MLVAALLLFAAVALFEIITPFLISSNLVKQRMERAVAQWTGHDVTIDGQPDLRFWPKARITLKGITIRKQINGGERVLGTIPRLSASFDLLGALTGQPEFRDFRIADAKISVIRDGNGRLDWTNDGLLSRAVRNARAEGSEQVLEESADAAVGNVRIRNGSIEITNQFDGSTVLVDGIDGDVRWPRLSQPASFRASAKVADHSLNLDLSSKQPLLLLSGKSGDLTVTALSDLFSVHFDGTTNLASHGFVAGDAELSTPDFAALLDWTGVDLPAVSGIKTMSLQARLVSTTETLRFDNLALAVNDVRATGVLDLALPEARRPRLTGTLAMESVDFSPVFSSLAPSMIDGSEKARALRSGLELDVRLSASRATLGPFELEEVAIGLMNIGDQSRFDILDSDFEGGRLTGRLATVKEGSDGGVAVRMSVHDADFASIIKRLGLRGPLPAAPASLELSVDVPRPLNIAAWRNAKGSLRFSAQRGVLPGINLTALKRLSGEKPYFSLSEAGDGDFDFDSLDVAVSLANGSADITEGRIAGPTETISLTGVIPYVNNSLAVSSVIEPIAGAEQTAPPSVLFIGGSWPDPVIWPISRPPRTLQ